MGLAPWFTVEDAYRWMHTLQHSLCMFSARKCLVRMFAHVLLGIVWCHCLTLSVLETNKIEARCKSPGWYCLNMDIVSTDLLSIYCSISFIYESHGVAKNARTTRNWQTFHWMEEKMNASHTAKKTLTSFDFFVFVKSTSRLFWNMQERSHLSSPTPSALMACLKTLSACSV